MNLFLVEGVPMFPSAVIVEFLAVVGGDDQVGSVEETPFAKSLFRKPDRR